MPPVIPYVPQRITVHLGPPSSDAANVTVPFDDYVKNVASSEIYPTWDESALRANILAITSYALNRVYTEFYRSRGYDFDITNSTAYDQFFVNGRSFFDNVSQLVDELFNDYLRRPGFVEPLAAKFCNGTTVTCAGLSQWGSQNLAQPESGPAGLLLHPDPAHLLWRRGNRHQRAHSGHHVLLSRNPTAAGYLRPQRRSHPGGAEPDIPELSRNPENPFRGRNFRSTDRSLSA